MEASPIVSKLSPRSTVSKKLGAAAEEFAYRYLKKQHLVLVTRNYACRFGEIDLIMRDQCTLVFIEVRYRQNHNFGHTLETIQPAKRHKLIRTAHYYLQCFPPLPEDTCRFDVFALTPLPESINDHCLPSSQHYPAHVEWVKNAFSL